MDTLYLGLTKGEIIKTIEERNISHQLYYKWLRGLDKYKTSAHQLYYKWLRGLDKYKTSASTILSVKNEIIEIINEYSPQQATGYLPKAMLFLLLKFQI